MDDDATGPFGLPAVGRTRVVAAFSCRSPLAEEVRLAPHIAVQWLPLTLRDRIPEAHELVAAEFATLKPRLLKVAGRVAETASRVRMAFAAACPHAALFRGLARGFHPAGP